MAGEEIACLKKKIRFLKDDSGLVDGAPGGSGLGLGRVFVMLKGTPVTRLARFCPLLSAITRFMHSVDTAASTRFNPAATFAAVHGEVWGGVVSRLKAAILNIVSPEVSALASCLEHSLGSAGKLLRPSMTILFMLLCLREDPAMAGVSDEALLDKLMARDFEAASVSELIHVATLLHDDVLDQSDLRRNVPTVRALWGNHLSILSGDYLLAQASMKLAKLGNIELVAIYSQVLGDLCEGEVRQMQAQGSTSFRWEDYLRKTHLKTGALFAAACEAAAILYAPEKRAACRHYGEQFGLLFQLRDDLLDLVADQAETGKPVLDDLRNGLLNAPVWLVLQDEHTPQALREELNAHVAWVFANRHDDTPAVKAAFTDTMQHIARLLTQGNAEGLSTAFMNSLLNQNLAAVEALFPTPSLWRDQLTVWSHRLLMVD
jgi:all-trans-nonaprenyl-diphosphate synthase